MQDNYANQQAMLALIKYQPLAAVLLQHSTRFERMAQELSFAIRHTSGADMTKLMGHLTSDGGSALVRRVTGLWDLAGKVIVGTVNELERMLNAYSADQFAEHLGNRFGTASVKMTLAVSNGAKSLSSLVSELKSNPSEAAPKLLVLVLSSVAASGGIDGNGGVPDLDIPLMGIGAHRSPFSHSILIGSLLETALLLLTRIVLCTHKNLPSSHDPLWEGIARQSVSILNSAGKGASIGIAYHLMVDAVIQPGTYHGLPIEMPLDVHQTIFAANSVAEATAVKVYPSEEEITTTPEILTAHKQFRAIQMPIPDVLREFLSVTDIAILAKYGAWLQALVKRDIPPTTLAQVQFLKVADDGCAPKSSHEIAWMALVCAKKQAGWTTTT